MYLETIVAGKSLSRHHQHWVWQGEAGGARMEILGWRKCNEHRGVNIGEMPGYIDIISLYKIHSLSFPAPGRMHSWQAFMDPPNLCGSSQPGTPSYPMTLFLYFLSQNFSKIYFSHWKPPGVSERMRRVNLDASIAGEYQTLGGHSGRHSE